MSGIDSFLLQNMCFYYWEKGPFRKVSQSVKRVGVLQGEKVLRSSRWPFDDLFCRVEVQLVWWRWMVPPPFFFKRRRRGREKLGVSQACKKKLFSDHALCMLALRQDSVWGREAIVWKVALIGRLLASFHVLNEWKAMKALWKSQATELA